MGSSTSNGCAEQQAYTGTETSEQEPHHRAASAKLTKFLHIPSSFRSSFSSTLLNGLLKNSNIPLPCHTKRSCLASDLARTPQLYHLIVTTSAPTPLLRIQDQEQIPCSHALRLPSSSCRSAPPLPSQAHVSLDCKFLASLYFCVYNCS